MHGLPFLRPQHCVITKGGPGARRDRFQRLHGKAFFEEIRFKPSFEKWGGLDQQQQAGKSKRSQQGGRWR